MPTIKMPPPCFALFKTEVLEAHGGRARLKLVAGEEHENPYGQVQGGLLAAMIDNCIGPAVMSIEPDRQSSTIELKVNYFGAVKPHEPVIAEATVIHHGRTTAYIEASLTRADGKLLARASATNVFLNEVSPRK